MFYWKREKKSECKERKKKSLTVNSTFSLSWQNKKTFNNGFWPVFVNWQYTLLSFRVDISFVFYTHTHTHTQIGKIPFSLQSTGFKSPKKNKMDDKNIGNEDK